MDPKPPKVVVSEISFVIKLFQESSEYFLQVGETLKVKVESSFPTSEVLYQVFCQSVLVLSGKLVAPSPATTHDLSLVLPQNVSHLLSTPRLVVEVLSPSNEILSDSLRFVVEQEKERPVRNNCVLLILVPNYNFISFVLNSAGSVGKTRSC